MDRRASTLFALALLSGCAATRTVPVNTAPSLAAIRAAEEAGAASVPRAAVLLKYARDELAAGETMAREGDDRRASLALLRAQTDAELALALVRESAAQAEAQRALEELSAARRRAR